MKLMNCIEKLQKYRRPLILALANTKRVRERTRVISKKCNAPRFSFYVFSIETVAFSKSVPERNPFSPNKDFESLQIKITDFELSDMLKP